MCPTIRSFGSRRLLLLIPPIFTTFRAASFEAARWRESDYAPVTKSGGGLEELTIENPTVPDLRHPVARRFHLRPLQRLESDSHQRTKGFAENHPRQPWLLSFHVLAAIPDTSEVSDL